MYTAVIGQRVPVGGNYLAPPQFRSRRGTFHESRIVAVRHEANLLALGLVGVCESERARPLANFRFGYRAERKKRACELALAKRKEEIRLILGAVDRSLEAETSVSVEVDTRSGREGSERVERENSRG